MSCPPSRNCMRGGAWSKLKTSSRTITTPSTICSRHAITVTTVSLALSDCCLSQFSNASVIEENGSFLSIYRLEWITGEDIVQVIVPAGGRRSGMESRRVNKAAAERRARRKAPQSASAGDGSAFKCHHCQRDCLSHTKHCSFSTT